MSTVGRLAVAASLLAGATGCGAISLEARSSGYVGCAPDEIEISNDTSDFGSRTWTATCQGRTHYCTAQVTGPNNSAVSCAPAGGGSRAPAPGGGPALAPASASGQKPPQGAAGFTFGANLATAEKLCVDAGLAWTPAQKDHYGCSGAPTEVGFPAVTVVDLCGGKVCKISVDAAHDESPWPQLTTRFAKVLGSLEAKYGSAQEKSTDTLDDCTDSVLTCFKKGRIEVRRAWKWPNGHTLELSMSGGAAGGHPTLWIVYRKPSEAPHVDAL